MHSHSMHPFWLAFAADRTLVARLLEAQPALAPVEVEEEGNEELEMNVWLNLSEDERAAVVEQYAQRRPRLSKLDVR